MDEAVEALKSCLFILELVAKINLLVEHRKYYNALKTLEELQQLHLRQIMNFELAKHIRK